MSNVDLLAQQQTEKRAARVYWWLFFSALITVPWMATNLLSLGFTDRFNSPLAYLLATISPALVHLVLLFGLLSSNLFIRRHAQQGLLLILLRVASAVWFVAMARGETSAWFLVNGSTWLFGTIWGIRQVNRGECWLMRARGENADLPRAWANAPTPTNLSASGTNSSGDAAFDLNVGLRLLDMNNRVEARTRFLAAFRNGSRELRERAAMELEKLGEVETF